MIKFKVDFNKELCGLVIETVTNNGHHFNSVIHIPYDDGKNDLLNRVLAIHLEEKLNLMIQLYYQEIKNSNESCPHCEESAVDEELEEQEKERDIDFKFKGMEAKLNHYIASYDKRYNALIESFNEFRFKMSTTELNSHIEMLVYKESNDAIKEKIQNLEKKYEKLLSFIKY